ncbi:MAG: zeta toxin family protein [Rickettsiales bacterium]|nr:zeta toxin family protein [Rickettsiales bacterium]
MKKIREKNSILREKVIDFIHRQWENNYKESENIDIGSEFFEITAMTLFKELTRDKRQCKKPFVFRIGGQSGSGKTTQLMPSIKSVVGGNFVDISVRRFAQSHPNYAGLLEKFGEGMIREKTNSFALLMLFRIIELLMESHYNILFEVTILSPDFENYLAKLAKKNRYDVHFHILSVPHIKSDHWIEKRMILSKTEGNRVVLKSSSNFFYDILPVALAEIMRLKIWTRNDKIFLWNGFDSLPSVSGKIYRNKKFMKLFEYYRNYDSFECVDEEKLLESKISWFRRYYSPEEFEF